MPLTLLTLSDDQVRSTTPVKFPPPVKFNVFRRCEYSCKHQSYQRNDFYKITLLRGEGKLQYADRGLTINSPALFFSNPQMTYLWEPISPEQHGFFCVFTDEFINTSRSRIFNDLQFFGIGTDPLVFLTEESLQRVNDLFENMLKDMETDYVHKYDQMRSYVDLMLHEAMKVRPDAKHLKFSNASSRLTSAFVELLERQFPIDSQAYALKFRTAHDYANQLSVHVNHLNRAVKETTGRTTTEIISDRIVQEAIAMLQHTTLNISEIAYGLGFDYPAHFNNFFKKQTLKTPGEFRSVRALALPQRGIADQLKNSNSYTS